MFVAAFLRHRAHLQLLAPVGLFQGERGNNSSAGRSGAGATVLLLLAGVALLGRDASRLTTCSGASGRRR